MGVNDFIYEVVGGLFILIGLSLVINKKYMGEIMEDSLKNITSMYMMGIVMFVFGRYIAFNFVLQNGLKDYIITIIGYLIVLKSIVILIFPKFISDISKKYLYLIEYAPILGIIYVFLGIYIIGF